MNHWGKSGVERDLNVNQRFRHKWIGCTSSYNLQVSVSWISVLMCLCFLFLIPDKEKSLDLCECTVFPPHILLLGWGKLLQMKYWLLDWEPDRKPGIKCFSFSIAQERERDSLFVPTTLSATNEQWKCKDDPEMERMSIAFSPTPLFLTFTFCLQTTLRALDQRKKKNTMLMRSCFHNKTIEILPVSKVK